MCGIFGSTFEYSDTLIRAKLERIKFRGPDNVSFQKQDGVTLGHTRLSIIDLDYRSNQPFNYAHLRIVFNGEIYNYQYLKNKLIKEGYNFTTLSDTEVICAAYLAYGANCVNHFNGMFAFVIYDVINNTFFGARDRLGKKPFYYYDDHSGFEFASQPSVIAEGKKLSIDPEAINAFHFWSCIPNSTCIYKGVKKLPAGCYFTYKVDNQDLKITRYWNIDYKWSEKFTGTYNDAVDQLQDILEDAVKIRMNADVPLGVFLSSGIDSSLIAAIAASHHKSVKTFNVRFDEKGFDESEASQKIAAHIGTNHHTIDCTYQEGIQMIEGFSKYYDEPFADSSALPGMLLASHTKPYVTVALTGDGGDESFLGYSRYNWMRKIQPFYNCPLILRKAMGWFLSLSPNYRHKLLAMGMVQKDLAQLYIKICSGMDHSYMLDPEPAFAQIDRFWLYNRRKPLLERISDYDLKTYLNNDINTKVDRGSMAYAIETRSPLMDHRVVEFAQSLPTSFKMNKLVQKRILKDILFKKVPAEYYNGPKSGFSVPLEKWFRNELKEYVLDTLTPQKLTNIPGINVSATMQMIGEHMDGKWNRAPRIWSLLVLSQWLESQVKVSTPSNALVL